MFLENSKSASMKNLILLFGACIMLICHTACEKSEHLFASTETKLQGQWVMDKVIFSPTLSFNQFNITDQYANLVFTFDEGNNLSRSNLSTGELANGSYRIDTEVEYTGDEIYQNVQLLSSALINNSNQDVTFIFWRDLNVTHKKITANEKRDGGNYRYTLVKN